MFYCDIRLEVRVVEPSSRQRRSRRAFATQQSHPTGLREETLKRQEISLFFLTPLSTITPDEYFERIHRIVSLLDDENTRIIRTMKQHGPRNILHIARESKLPYTTVYSRVVKLESMSVLRTCIHPHYSKLVLPPAILYATPFAGKELLAKELLQI